MRSEMELFTDRKLTVTTKSLKINGFLDSRTRFCAFATAAHALCQVVLAHYSQDVLHTVDSGGCVVFGTGAKHHDRQT